MPLTTEEVRGCPPPGGCGGTGWWSWGVRWAGGHRGPRCCHLGVRTMPRLSHFGHGCWVWDALCGVLGCELGPPGTSHRCARSPQGSAEVEEKGLHFGCWQSSPNPRRQAAAMAGAVLGSRGSQQLRPHLRVCGSTWGRFVVRRSGEETCPAAGMMDGISGTTTMRSLRRRTAEHGHTRPWVLFFCLFFFPRLPRQAGREIAAGTWAVGRAGSGPRPGVRAGGPWGNSCLLHGSGSGTALLRASVSPLAHCSTAWGSCTPSASTATRRARRARAWRW